MDSKGVLINHVTKRGGVTILEKKVHKAFDRGGRNRSKPKLCHLRMIS